MHALIALLMINAPAPQPKYHITPGVWELSFNNARAYVYVLEPDGTFKGRDTRISFLANRPELYGIYTTRGTWKYDRDTRRLTITEHLIHHDSYGWGMKIKFDRGYTGKVVRYGIYAYEYDVTMKKMGRYDMLYLQ